MIHSAREFWAVFHGMVLGSIFLLSFSGVLVGLYGFRPDWLTPQGIRHRIRLLKIGTIAMAIASWLTVITGTYIVYPWYRAKPPEGVANLLDYPRSYLLSVPDLVIFHTFGMEWKEHVAWFSPILATVVAYLVWHFSDQIAENLKLRNAIAAVFIISFSAAAIAGLFGAFIAKAAPIL
ncbi:MAG: hypothetical protein HZB24_13555 [Desulfobacterales bacterium]|nr:hypothetical protein [Desulfobacterales bacterium]